MYFLTKMQFKFENLFNRLVKMIPSASGKILYNKWVLYFIFVVGIYDIIHFYQRGNTMAVAIFFIVGFLTSFFSKNMIVVIVSAIAVSHIVAYGNKMSEGFEGEEEEEEGFEDEVVEDEVVEDEVVEDEVVEDEVVEDEVVEEDDSAKTNSKKKKSTQADESFINNIDKMKELLNQTEQILSESSKQGFTGMFKNDYAPFQ
jgi:hypothetical protein